MAAAGVFITGFGGAIYLIANLGPGPKGWVDDWTCANYQNHP